LSALEHDTVVPEVQAVVEHVVADMARVGVALVLPKLRPEIVTLSRLLAGLFGTLPADTAGESNVNPPTLVLTCDETVRTVFMFKPVRLAGPIALPHSREVAVLHAVVWHKYSSKTAVGVRLVCAKFIPYSETNAPPLCGKFSRVACVTTGAS
jgi:hypothetical protein